MDLNPNSITKYMVLSKTIAVQTIHFFFNIVIELSYLFNKIRGITLSI